MKVKEKVVTSSHIGHNEFEHDIPMGDIFDEAILGVKTIMGTTALQLKWEQLPDGDLEETVIYIKCIQKICFCFYCRLWVVLPC